MGYLCLLILILLVMCSCLSHNCRGLDAGEECLLAFKGSVVDASNSLSSWDLRSNSSAADICGFIGITCWSPGDDRIMGLRLQGLGLAGDPFPPGLSKCSTNLQNLDLSHNSFSGPLIPSDLCQRLPYLTTLDLSHNQFSGEIPSTLKDCIYLQTLQLQGNLFTGQIPWELATLPHLIQLNLSHNLLSGPIPSSFTNTSSLIPRAAFPPTSFDGNPRLFGPPLSLPSPHHYAGPLLFIEIASGPALLLLLSIVIISLALGRRSLQRRRKNIPATSAKMFHPYLRLSWKSLEQATSNFSHANILGVGGSSTVYKGQLPDGHMVAIKVLQREDSMSCDVQKQFLTELEVLGRLRHRNLVRILGYCDNLEDTMVAIIIDFMPMGSLDALLHSHSTFPQTILGSDKGNSQQLKQWPNIGWEARFRILTGIAEGLAYLHHEYDGKHCVIHGDLKPGNVLLDEHMEAHIADFGLARMVGAANTTSIAMPSARRKVLSEAGWWSFGYTAPECAQQGVVSRKADVFSFGMTTLELMTGERPSSSKLEEGQTLADWVGQALATSGAVEGLVASNTGLEEGMTNNWKKWEADIVAILKLGCRCTSYQPSARPHMHRVVAFLHDLAHERHSASHLDSANAFERRQVNNEDELWMLSIMA